MCSSDLQIDSFGINIEKLNKSGANIAQVSPSHHFPTGIVMPIKRRQELLSWAGERKNRFIIEDDYDSEFRFSGKILATMQSQDFASKVIYMNTFSKTLSPSFRISYMILPERLSVEFEKKLGSYSCQVSSFEQFTLAKFIEEGHYEKHLNKMKNYYRGIRNDFINAIKKSKLSLISEIQEENSGLHFILNVRTKYSGENLKKRLLEKKINIALLSDYFHSDLNDSDKKTAFVVNYSALKKQCIEKAVDLFYECCL